MDVRQEALRKHYEWKGKLRVDVVPPLDTRAELSLAYTPGVAEPCLAIKEQPDEGYALTRRWNLVAVVTDGTAVLGLGDIGPRAAMPVMEGKCALFKRFAGIDAFPLCINSRDPDEIVRTVELISYSFGGINLEDIAAPRCFEIERRLRERCEIPVFHDDQHGTAVVAAAAVLNALRVVGKKMGDMRVVINGAGAAGISIAKLLLRLHVGDIVLCDVGGALCRGGEGMNPAQEAMAQVTNRAGIRGSLADAMRGADLFIGVSRPRLVTPEMVRSMAKDPVVFPMANPTPEIMPDEAKAGGARVVGTGRSDFPNQINNLLAFPGIFKGALRVRARDISESMTAAAARAIAGMVEDSRLGEEYILPDVFEPSLADRVADAVAAQAKAEGLARI